MKENESALPTYGQIARFFLPLALTNLIMSLSHTIVNAGVARTPNPEISLSAYALARSIVRIIENPMFMVRQTVVSLAKDYKSFLRVKRYMYILAGAVTVFIAILGFSPLGYYLFRNLVGVTEPVARQSHTALMVLFLLPLTTVARNIYHGLAILSRQTILVPKTSVLRLGVMSALIFPLARFTQLPGALSASIAFIAAFFIEAVVMRWRALPMLGDSRYLPKEKEGYSLGNGDIARFFLPLVITTFMATAFAPMINFGLARSFRPEVALAAYAVGNSVANLFKSPMNMLHQTTLAFVKLDVPETLGITRRFAAGFALLASGLLALLSFSPLGSWLLEGAMGLTGQVAISARLVLQVMTLMPLVIAWRQYLWGILMQQRKTKLIGGGKAINFAVLAIVLVALLVSGRVDPAAAGAWAMVIGEFSECAYMQVRFVKVIGQA